MDATYNVYGSPKPTMKRNADLDGPDFYPTPRWATYALIDNEKFNGRIWECACGDGAMSEVLQETGDVEALVKDSVALIGGNQMLGAFLMLVIGLLVTMGIGSSFSTIPIIATIFVPLCLELGMSPIATICIVGTAGALGDAGSPASDSTLGPTSGLAVDRQHDHIWDTCVPTFLHYNIPLIIFGWIASVIL